MKYTEYVPVTAKLVVSAGDKNLYELEAVSSHEVLARMSGDGSVVFQFTDQEATISTLEVLGDLTVQVESQLHTLPNE